MGNMGNMRILQRGLENYLEHFSQTEDLIERKMTFGSEWIEKSDVFVRSTISVPSALLQSRVLKGTAAANSYQIA
jgi:hypothetical protein